MSVADLIDEPAKSILFELYRINTPALHLFAFSELLEKFYHLILLTIQLIYISHPQKQQQPC
ncbi:hypothetical protein DRF67_20240 [Chryseobacterium pennipullorum]|uniref:Uncharacterized protein n=1 Tax=Chryseobacterium pennipullorum TaxID=2258963 RepID=A0A3D9AMY4_9FLAO|nr:hypothetical protein DRF67_20240 [Chryseobacterium pennipullorum]